MRNAAFSTLSCFLLAALGSAFAPIAIPPSSRVQLQLQKLSDIDEMCLENVAELCLDETAIGCDLEDHEALLNQLAAQRSHLAEHMQKIDSLVGKLQGTPEVNGADKPFFVQYTS